MSLSVCAVVGMIEEHPFHAQALRHVRRSWECYETCTAVLLGSLAVLSVHAPNDGAYDEEDYILRHPAEA